MRVVRKLTNRQIILFEIASHKRKKIDTKTAANSLLRARELQISLYDSINALLFFYIKSARENIDYYDDDDDTRYQH